MHFKRYLKFQINDSKRLNLSLLSLKYFHFFFFVLCVSFLLLQPKIALSDLPDSVDEYINDFADLINPEQENEIRKKLLEVEKSSGIEITVVTVESFANFSEEFTTWESFATALFNKWGVCNLPDNDGVMLLIARENRKIRIELGAGYSSEYNVKMKRIIDENIYPELKEDDFNQGIYNGVNKIVESVTQPTFFHENYIWFIFAGIAFFVSFVFGNKSKDSDGFGGGYSDGGGASGGD